MNHWMDKCVTLTRERDEARAEVERLRGALVSIEAASGETFAIDMAKEALEGAKK